MKNIFSERRSYCILGMMILLSGYIFNSRMVPPGFAKEITLQTQGQTGGVIAYVEVDGDIYLYIGDTNERIQLTTDADQYYYSIPRFSPNGRHLAFLKTDPEKGESYFDLYVMDLATKAARRLAENVGSWGNYDWAPDSQTIVYGFSIEKTCSAYDQENTYGIWQVRIDTGETQEIIPANGPSEPLKNPRFSFDGNWISYESFPCFSEGFRLHTREFSSNQVHDFGFGEMDWAPGQNMIVWSQDVWAGGNGGLVLTAPDQGEEQIIMEAGDLATGDPHWSPDDQWIALRRYTLTDGLYTFSDEVTVWEDHLILVRADGSNQKEICSSEQIWGCRMVEWSPSASQLIYTAESEEQVDWYLYTLETGESASLPDFGEGGVDWIESDRLPQSYFPTAEVTQEPSVTKTAAPEPDPVSLPAEAKNEDSPSENPVGNETIKDPLFSIWFGAGLILAGLVVVVVIVRKSK